jgi:uncharacterized protein with PQ loop repeat
MLIEVIPTIAYVIGIIGYGSQLIKVFQGRHCRSVSLFKYALSSVTYGMLPFYFWSMKHYFPFVVSIVLFIISILICVFILIKRHCDSVNVSG